MSSLTYWLLFLLFLNYCKWLLGPGKPFFRFNSNSGSVSLKNITNENRFSTYYQFHILIHAAILFLFGKVVNRLSKFLRKETENSVFEHFRKISYYNNDDICLLFYLYFKFMAPRVLMCALWETYWENKYRKFCCFISECVCSSIASSLFFFFFKQGDFFSMYRI